MIGRHHRPPKSQRARIFYRREEAPPEKPKSQRVAAYVRVSTEEQAQHGYSIAAQIEKLESMCKSQDWQMLPVYVDDGYSGKNLERPAVQRLLEEGRKRRFDVVLVYKLDRLSRRLSDLVSLGEQFEKLGIGLRSLTEPFDTTYPAGKLLFNMLGSFAQFERELIAERTRLGLARRLREGKWNGRAPFGYMVNGEGRLVQHPSDAQSVKRIFQLFLEEHLGITWIARRMNQEDKASCRRGRWYGMFVWNILTGPAYAGKVIISGKIQDGSHPAFITMEQFELIQKRLRSNAHAPAEQLHSPNILTGIIHCGRCGRPMTTAKGWKNGRKYYYYACRRRIVERTCDLEYIPARNIEARVLTELRKLAAQPDLIEKYLSELKEQEGKVALRLREERDALKYQLEAAGRSKDAKVRWLAETLPDRLVAAEVGGEIGRQVAAIDDMTRKLADLDRRVKEAEAETAKSEEIAEFLGRFDEGFESLTVTQKRRMIQSLVKDVRVLSVCEAKVLFSIPSSPPAEWKTGPLEAPFIDEERFKGVPTEILPPSGPGSPLHTRWLRD